MRAIKIDQEYMCPDCGKEMLVKWKVKKLYPDDAIDILSERIAWNEADTAARAEAIKILKDFKKGKLVYKKVKR